MKIISTILYTVFVLILITVGGVFLASLLPIPGQVTIKIVKSGSMEPAIPTGSIVVVQPQESYHLGDVITFGEDTRIQIPTTHRIVKIDDVDGFTIFTTKGDANNAPDPTQTKLREVEGKVILHVPYAGFVLDFAKRPLGFLLMIALPAAIIILDEVLRIIREVVALRRKKFETV